MFGLGEDPPSLDDVRKKTDFFLGWLPLLKKTIGTRKRSLAPRNCSMLPRKHSLAPRKNSFAPWKWSLSYRKRSLASKKCSLVPPESNGPAKIFRHDFLFSFLVQVICAL